MRRRRTRSVDDVWDALTDSLGALAERTVESILGPREPRPQEVLTYRDVVTCFLAMNHHAEGRAQGVALREPHPQGTLVSLAVIDEAGRVMRDRDDEPLGHRFVAGRLDDELSRLFGADDVVLFT